MSSFMFPDPLSEMELLAFLDADVDANSILDPNLLHSPIAICSHSNGWLQEEGVLLSASRRQIHLAQRQLALVGNALGPVIN